jgi:serine/threonine protein kinase
MGIVYRATDMQSQVEVAVKSLPPALARDPTYLARFEREAAALRDLNHPNIVPYIDTFQEGMNYFLVMEYMPGGSLYDRLQAEGALSIEDARQIAIDISDALIRAHRLDIIHRDLKPENILFDGDGNPHLADFGVAGVVSETTRLTGTGTQVGTPYYMSPEAWHGERLDAQSDIWSLGIVLYEILAGELPFDGSTAIVIMREVLQTPTPDIRQIRDDIPDGLYEIIRKALAKDKAQRYQSMREVVLDLERGQPAVLLRGSGIGPRASRRSGLLVAGAILVLMIVGAVVGFLLLSGEEEPQLAALDGATESPTSEPTPTDTVTPSLSDTPLPTPTLSATDREATIQAIIGDNLTQTATLSTFTATPNLQLTADARLTHTQVAFFDAQTSTVDAWTDTPTSTVTETPPPTATDPPTPTETFTPSDTPTPPPTATYTPSLTATSTPSATPTPSNTPTPTEAPFGFSPITRNADWRPYSEIITGAEMVLVPVGCFLMGSEEGFGSEVPVHEQCFAEPFWIDRTEVSRAMYAQCTAAGGCPQIPESIYSSRSDQPINDMTWFTAQTYCAWRGARLPTEAEWEYAARGPDNLVYPWGNQFVSGNLIWFETANNETATVGSRPSGASWVGALDMLGNVWEWTSTISENYPYSAQDGRENAADMTSRRVARGSSAFDGDRNARNFIRIGLNPDHSDNRGFGMRCARDFG